MQFRVLMILCGIAMSGCVHRGVDAASTAFGALIMSTVRDREAPPRPVDTPLDAFEDAKAYATTTELFCSAQARAEVMQYLSLSLRECREAWVHRNLPDYGAFESQNLMNAKIGFESLIHDCGGDVEERAMAEDFWHFVWKPSQGTWPKKLYGCYGTPTDRSMVEGATLEAY